MARARSNWGNYQILAVSSGRHKAGLDGMPPSVFEEDSKYGESKQTLFPWMKKLKEPSKLRDSSPIKAIALAAHGLVGINESGFEADVAETAKFFCQTDQTRESEDEAEDCATAIKNAEYSIETADCQVLRMLEEIASAALDQSF
ncbi:MAG: hypothetical protein OXG24_02610 [Gammaproteobacteria bacterium]|nr:hypothetical protein [Gammaproteobacteria bacterium]